MRNLRKNRKPFYYALYEGNEMLIGEDGYKTGEWASSYSKPVEVLANVSAATGGAVAAKFGTYNDYSRIIVTHDLTLPIDEQSVLWVETMPVLDAEGNATNPPDYVVKHIAKTLNVVSYAVGKADISV